MSRILAACKFEPQGQRSSLRCQDLSPLVAKTKGMVPGLLFGFLPEPLPEPLKVPLSTGFDSRRRLK